MSFDDDPQLWVLRDPDWLMNHCGGEFHLEIDAASARSFFRRRGSLKHLDAFRAGFIPRSRRGLMQFFAVALESRHAGLLSPMHFAHIAAEVWCEGKQSTALAEFGLESACPPGWLVRQLDRYRVSPVIMSAIELAAFEELPTRFAVYRGGIRNANGLAMGHSWTTSLEVATTFAKRSSDAVVKRTISKSDVVAFLTERNEREVVLIPRSWAGADYIG